MSNRAEIHTALRTMQPYKYSIIVALDPNGRTMMTRDMELIRRILLEIKARKTVDPEPIEIDGVDSTILFRHVEMLHEAGMIVIKGNVHQSSLVDETDLILVKDMTMAGHDFIGVLENKGVWNKIKQSFTTAELAALTLTVMKDVGVELLKGWARNKVGLPSP